MHKLELIVVKPNQPLPISALREPFSVLVDVRDPEWSNGVWVKQTVADLLEAGCRYFVCFGPNSEVVHDEIDDVILDRSPDADVLTTFHDDETVGDVANFFVFVAMRGMAQGLALVHDVAGWKESL